MFLSSLLHVVDSKLAPLRVCTFLLYICLLSVGNMLVFLFVVLQLLPFLVHVIYIILSHCFFFFLISKKIY